MRSVTEKSYARIGLMGNPSDGYGGKTLSAIVKNFSAEVTLTESEQLQLAPDQYQFDSVKALQRHIRNDGYYGASRLFKATLKVFAGYISGQQNSAALQTNFKVSYQTNIPRMVGLAGSSALIVAMLKALQKFYALEVDQRILPSLALAVERDELKIGGGLQDRVIQIYEGLVAMDFAGMDSIDGYLCGDYQSLDTGLLPPLYLAYSLDEGEPTEVFHNDLRSRYNAGDALVVNAMQEFAELSDQAVYALKQSDYGLFGRLMDKNFDLRQSISTLNTHHVLMIETARACGVSAKYAGSGGAIVGVCESETGFDKLKTQLEAIGCVVVRPVISPDYS